MAVTAELWDFVKTAKHPTLMIVGVVGIVCLGEFLIWVETSRKDIKLWSIEITQPESDGVKSCRAIQAAFHDKALGLESKRKATYQVMENDEASIDAFTKLQLEAETRNQNTYDYAHNVTLRINNLINDSNQRQQHLEWLNETETYYTQRVEEECGSLLPKSQ
jgi:hypothetical protein